jgi:ATP-dependent Clp protease adapter protein ClpS
MLVFSQNLNRSLGRAIALAEQQFYNCATPEHVLLALLDDPDAIPVMRACHVDVEKLRGAVEASMPHSHEALDPDERIPVEHFQVVLQRAIAHAQSSGCEEVNSADVLVAMLDGPVGNLLNAHGLTRYDATSFICHGISGDDDVNQSGRNARCETAASSPTFKLQLLNDAYTPMDFVVHVLEDVLELAREEAERIMLEIHHEGIGACGTFTREEAEARAARIMALARQHQHPLRCSVQHGG